MVECPDDSDGPPAGSFERLLQDLEDVEATFAEEAASNRQKQESADRPPKLQQPYRVPDEEFNPEPYLLVPYSPGSERRPMNRRPPAEPPLTSQGVTVLDESGGEASHIMPDDTYSVECTLQNKGGLPARNTYVELYVEQKADDATVDTNASPDSDTATGSVEIARSRETDLSGFTTVPHGSRLELMIFPKGTKDDPVALQRDLIHWVTVRVNETREFEASIDGDFDGDDREIVLRVYDTSLITGDPDDYGSYGAILNGNLLTEVPATFVDDPDNRKRPLPLESSVSSSATGRIGKTHTDVPPSDDTTVSFEYLPSNTEDVPELSGDFRGLSVFYVRAYSIASSDTPEDWERLDHTRSRFVGRTEVKGRLLPPALRP